MRWSTLSWAQQHAVVTAEFGGGISYSHGDDLLALLDAILRRGLSEAYIAELAALLNIAPAAGGYSPAEILAMMTADTAYHWPAALRAAGVAVEV